MEWLERGMETQDPVDKLSNLWRGFNSLFADESGRYERDKIKTFLSSNSRIISASEIITECSDDVGYLMSQPVIDMRSNGRDSQRDINAFDGTESAIKKLKAIFMVVYQIRCNLEHGQKSPSDERDNLLCLHASSIVTQVLKKCITVN